MVFLLLVLIDGFSVFQDLCHGLDQRYEIYKVLSEFCNIKDVEEDEELSLLCLLLETAPG